MLQFYLFNSLRTVLTVVAVTDELEIRLQRLLKLAHLHNIVERPGWSNLASDGHVEISCDRVAALLAIGGSNYYKLSTNKLNNVSYVTLYMYINQITYIIDTFNTRNEHNTAIKFDRFISSKKIEYSIWDKLHSMHSKFLFLIMIRCKLNTFIFMTFLYSYLSLKIFDLNYK